jgi:hypothetical protein
MCRPKHWRDEKGRNSYLCYVREGGQEVWALTWYSAHAGKYWRRRLHKCERAVWKGHGRERSLAHWYSEVSWKAT